MIFLFNHIKCAMFLLFCIICYAEINEKILQQIKSEFKNIGACSLNRRQLKNKSPNVKYPPEYGILMQLKSLSN